jgi:hypothetical protein
MSVPAPCLLRLPASLQYVSFHTPYLQQSTAQAVGYGSKRDDSARCLMLFKQRLLDPPFEILGEEPLAVGPRRAELLALVRSLKLHEV